ncbi:MAG TPA: PepSY domain-containing protein [Polyangia bacterium]|nr:PepSY domain-containing protein [Polyangia bacterium]
MRTLLIALALFAATATTTAAKAPPPAVPITMEQARATALARVPGRVTSEELEQEGGKWIYSFDIRDARKRTMEIHVDARSGEILSVARE